MGQNFWIAIVAWTICFILTIAISIGTQKTKPDAQLVGLVYSLTPRPKVEGTRWYSRPSILGAIILVVAIALNIIFW
jgi:SSS family solute:Na+ symporter